MGNSKTLWSDPDRQRHFVIPDEESLGTGDIELRTPLGRQLFIAEGAADAYEVSQQEAVAWLSSQFSTVINNAKDAILESMQEKMTREPDVDAWFDERRRGRQARSTATRPSNQDEHVPSAQVRSGAELPDVFSAALEALKNEFAQTESRGSNSTSGMGFSPDSATDDLHTVLDRTSDLISRLRASFLAQSDSEQTAEGLESFARHIEEAAASISRSLQTLANEARASRHEEGSAGK